MFSPTTTLLLITLSISLVFTSPIPTAKLLSPIAGVNKHLEESAKTEESTTNDGILLTERRSDIQSFDTNVIQDNMKAAESSISRQNKMFGNFYDYYPPPMPTQAAFYQPSNNYFDDFGTGGYLGGGESPDYSNFVSDEEENSGRANQRRRPQSSTKNSPIFYIRLPPTPYMFVPGMGYVSQPPTMNPIAPVAPTVSPYGGSPFFNVPLNFMSNGKPSNIYQWSGGQQFGMPYPQRPTYQPPQRPYRPSNPYLQDSKITRLKGPFQFNGRPEDVFILPNPYNQFSSMYNNPFHNYY